MVIILVNLALLEAIVIMETRLIIVQNSEVVILIPIMVVAETFRFVTANLMVM